jgi:hypothetical protein
MDAQDRISAIKTSVSLSNLHNVPNSRKRSFEDLVVTNYFLFVNEALKILILRFDYQLLMGMKNNKNIDDD